MTISEMSVAELLDVLAQLRTAGLAPVPRPDAALAQAMRDDGASDRIAELEQELEEAGEESSAELAELRGQLARAVALRDRFERERDQAQREAKGAHTGHTAAVAAGRDAQERQELMWVLRQLGMNVPGFAQMDVVELRSTAERELLTAMRTGADMRVVVKELLRAARTLRRNLEEPNVLPDEENPPALAGAVAGLADMSVRARTAALSRQRELEDRLAELEGENARANALGEETLRLQAERDALTRSRDAQAATLRKMRDEIASDAVTLAAIRKAARDLLNGLERDAAQLTIPGYIADYAEKLRRATFEG